MNGVIKCLFIYFQDDAHDPDWKPPRWMEQRPAEGKRQVTWKCGFCDHKGAGTRSRDQHPCPMDQNTPLYSPWHREIKKIEHYKVNT